MNGLAIRPAHDLRSRVCRRTLEVDDEGRRKDDNDRRWDNRGDSIDEKGVLSRDEDCDNCEENEACRDETGRGG